MRTSLWAPWTPASWRSRNAWTSRRSPLWTTAPDGTLYASGWSVDPATGAYLSEILHNTGGQWAIDSTPNPGSGLNGFAGIAAVPGGGVWAVGVTSNKANNSTLIAYHC